MPSRDGLAGKRSAVDIFGELAPPLEQPWCLQIKPRLATLHQRLVKSGEWNLGEQLEVVDILRRVRAALSVTCRASEPSQEAARGQLAETAEARRRCFASVLQGICDEERHALHGLEELCFSQSADSGVLQSATEVGDVYRHAASARVLLNRILVSLRHEEGIVGEAAPKLQFAELRSLARTLEKLIIDSGNNNWQCGNMCDVLRATFTVQSIAQCAAIVRALKTREDLRIVRAKQSFMDVDSTGWGDFRIALSVRSDPNEHKCEIRIVHHRMAAACDALGGDSEYRRLRGLGEALEFNQTGAKTRRAEVTSEVFAAKVMNVDSAATAELGLCGYPSVPLSEYCDDGDHLFINAEFPGLRAIHRDPWIFLVPGLLTREECERLMIKGSTRMISNDRFNSYAPDGGAHRTSSEYRIAREETCGIQSRYSCLLRVPAENLEAAKVTRYGSGQYFKNHVDPLCNTTNLENRIATLFVYLNTCKKGGETRFLSLPSKRQLMHTVGEKVCCLHDGEGDFPGTIASVHSDGTADVNFDDGDKRERVPFSELRTYEVLSVKPVQGMGVLFFPAYLPSSKLAMQNYKQLDRHLTHEGSAAVDEKWVHQSWVWPSRPQAHFDGDKTDGVIV